MEKKGNGSHAKTGKQIKTPVQVAPPIKSRKLETHADARQIVSKTKPNQAESR